MGLNIIGVDRSKQFLDNLKGITDPEEKEKLLVIPSLMFLTKKLKKSKCEMASPRNHISRCNRIKIS